MPQTSIYLDDATALFVRGEAKKRGTSLSKLVGQVLSEYATQPRDAWPAGYWESAYGCWRDDAAGDAPGAVGALDAADASGAALVAAGAAESCLDPELDDACDWWAE